MAARAAGQDLNLIHIVVKSLRKRQCNRISRSQSGREMAIHPKSRRFRLLMDLLQHEVAEVALVGHPFLNLLSSDGVRCWPLPLLVVKLDAKGAQ